MTSRERRQQLIDWNYRCNSRELAMCLILSIKKGIASIHLAKSRAGNSLRSAEIRKMVYANASEVVEALKGIDVLLMVSARENPERVEEHMSFFKCRKASGVQISSIPPLWGTRRQLYLVSRSCPDGSLYQGVGVHLHFLRDTFTWTS